MTLATEQTRPANSAQALGADARREFWRHWDQWVLNASDDELKQLEAALKACGARSTCSFIEVVRQALADKAMTYRFPPTFLAPIKTACWLGVAAAS